MWTKEKYGTLKDIQYVKAGKGTASEWKRATEDPEDVCLEMKVNNKILAFRCASVYGKSHSFFFCLFSFLWFFLYPFFFVMCSL